MKDRGPLFIPVLVVAAYAFGSLCISLPLYLRGVL